MDPYKLMLALAGLALIGATWLPHLLKRHPVTFPMVYVTLGFLLYASPLQLPDPDPFEFSVVTERLTELVVLVALVGAGLRIDTPFGWRHCMRASAGRSACSACAAWVRSITWRSR